MAVTKTHDLPRLVQFWHVGCDGQPVARLMMTRDFVGRLFPDSAVLLLNRQFMSPSRACRLLAEEADNDGHEIVAIEALIGHLRPVTVGASGEYSRMYVYGESKAHAAEILMTQIESPLMFTPLDETAH